MKRTANAQWMGDLKTGKGTISTESGSIKSVSYAFTNRFENTPGTNPEELIAAAHAACFSMAFSNNLATAGFKPEKVETKCTITFEKEAAGWTIKESTLECNAKVPGAPKELVQQQAEAAKKGCPVSRALTAAITLRLTVDEAGAAARPASPGAR
jgi:lipoyl-dependent peroxiredoxin